MRIDPKTMRYVEVTSVLSRTSRGDFLLCIEDKTSGLIILEISLEPNAIADLISSRMGEPQQAKYYHNNSIGKKKVSKTVQIDLSTFETPLFQSYDSSVRNRDLKEICSFAETLHPGWSSENKEYSSGAHKGNKYSVYMYKYEDV